METKWIKKQISALKPIRNQMAYAPFLFWLYGRIYLLLKVFHSSLFLFKGLTESRVGNLNCWVSIISKCYEIFCWNKSNVFHKDLEKSNLFKI
jgi:hypothetical protein